MYNLLSIDAISGKKNARLSPIEGKQKGFYLPLDPFIDIVTLWTAELEHKALQFSSAC